MTPSICPANELYWLTIEARCKFKTGKAPNKMEPTYIEDLLKIKHVDLVLGQITALY